MALTLQVDVEKIDAALERNQLESVDTPSVGMSGEILKVHGACPFEKQYRIFNKKPILYSFSALAPAEGRSVLGELVEIAHGERRDHKGQVDDHVPHQLFAIELLGIHEHA